MWGCIMSKPNVLTEIAIKMAQDNPTAPSRTLANKLVESYPEYFSKYETRDKAVEYARGIFRRIFGQSGNKSLKSNKSLYRPSRLPGVPAQQFIPDTTPVKLTGYKKLVLLADIHLPYHDEQKLELALSKIQDFAPDALILLGDLMDSAAISTYPKWGYEAQLLSELRAVEEFMLGIKNLLPEHCAIFWKHGNHEDRLRRYISLNSTSLVNAVDSIWYDNLPLLECNIQIVPSYRIIIYEDYTIIHGHETKSSSTNLTNPALQVWKQSGGGKVIAGHFHVYSWYKPPGWKDAFACTLGCFMSKNMPYMMGMPRLDHGFGYIDNGKFKYEDLN